MTKHPLGEVCLKEKDIAKLQEQMKTAFKKDETLQETINKFDNTQSELIEAVTTMNATFKTLIYVGGVVGTLLGGLSLFLVTELIKII